MYEKNNIFWTEQKKNTLIKLYKEGKSDTEIAIIFNKTESSIKNFRIKCLRLIREEQIFLDSDFIFIKENYPKYGIKYCESVVKKKIYKNILKKLNLSPLSKSVRSKIVTKNLKNRYKFKQKDIDINKFLNINLPEVAYFLGYFWADGYVKKDGEKRDCSLHFSQKDFESINKICSFIGKFNIYFRKKLNSVQISTIHNELVDFLISNDYRIKSEITPSKILTKIPNNLKRYFWLGFFDGDGCFCMSGRGKTFSFTGTYNQNWDDLKQLLLQLNIKYNLIQVIDKLNHKYSRISFSTSDSCYKFGNYLYPFGYEFSLKRKFDKWLIFKTKYDNKIQRLSK